MTKTCNSCNTNDIAVMPIAQHEKDQNRLMSIIKLLIAITIILIVLLVGSNVGWLIYESQFETITYEQDGEGINNVNLGEQGDLNNGAESENQTEEER
jgi:hypothetical protein